MIRNISVLNIKGKINKIAIKFNKESNEKTASKSEKKINVLYPKVCLL
jgi:hypothetical protein